MKDQGSSRPFALIPELILNLSATYTKYDFFKDVQAGIVVGIVALPLSIAFAIASGVSPEQGIITAIIAGFFIALLGGSRVQVSGPTGAFIVVIYGIVQTHGYPGLAIATILAGILLIILGLTRCGDALRYVPYPLIVGFTSGIGLIIFSSQIKDALGLEVAALPADFIQKWGTLYKALPSVNWAALLLTLSALLVIAVWPRITKKVPGSLIAIVLGTIVVSIFDIPVKTVGMEYGEVRAFIPFPEVPIFTWEDIQTLIRPAISIALLGGIESLLSAVVSDGMTGYRHRPHMELVAQGVGNVLSPLFGGIPATGAIARTAVNVRNGGRTPVAALVHAVTILCCLLFLGSSVALIPLPVLAAILIMTAWHMSEAHIFLRLLRAPKGDVVVLLLTFFITVLFDLTLALEIGIVVSSLLFLHRMGGSLKVAHQVHGGETGAQLHKDLPSEVQLFDVDGPLFYAALEEFRRVISIAAATPRAVFLNLEDVTTLDSSALAFLEQYAQQLHQLHAQLYLIGLHTQPLKSVRRYHLIVRNDNVVLAADVDKALQIYHQGEVQ